jgi:uncharacterized membrane protein
VGVALRRPWLVAVLALGVFSRFYTLDHKILSSDEVFTALRISGYTVGEVKAVDRPLRAEEWQRYQGVNPERGLRDTIRSLIEDVHPPLFFLMLRFWEQWFGSSLEVMRSLAAVFSLLILPCLYWLCRELFEAPMVAWMAVALMAVSPFHVLYAQEARPYSLWTVTILLSSVAFLRALRLRSAHGWAMYAATVALGIYVHYLTVLLVAAYGLYIVATAGQSTIRALKAYVLASAAGLLTIVPWLLVASQIGGAGYTRRKTSLMTPAQRWLINVNSTFFDAQVHRRDPLFEVGWGSVDDPRFGLGDASLYLMLLILTLVVASLYCLCRETPRGVWMLPAALIGVVGSALLVPDLVSGGQRSTIGRYLIPCYLGMQLAVAYVLTVRTGVDSTPRGQRRLWEGTAIALVVLATWSCAVSSQARGWWSKYDTYYDAQVAMLIDRAASPVVLVGGPIQLLALSHLVDPRVELRLVEVLPGGRIPATPRETFAFYPSKSLLQGLERERSHRLRPVMEKGHLWRLEPIREGA